MIIMTLLTFFGSCLTFKAAELLFAGLGYPSGEADSIALRRLLERRFIFAADPEGSLDFVGCHLFGFGLFPEIFSLLRLNHRRLRIFKKPFFCVFSTSTNLGIPLVTDNAHPCVFGNPLLNGSAGFADAIPILHFAMASAARGVHYSPLVSHLKARLSAIGNACHAGFSDFLFGPQFLNRFLGTSNSCFHFMIQIANTPCVALLFFRLGLKQLFKASDVCANWLAHIVKISEPVKRVGIGLCFSLHRLCLSTFSALARAFSILRQLYNQHITLVKPPTSLFSHYFHAQTKAITP